MADELNPDSPSIAEDSNTKLYNSRILLNAKINKLMASLDTKKQMFDPVMLRAAQGFLAPTKTGSFGESLGNVAGGVAEEQAKQQANEQAKLETQFKLSQLKYGMDKENAQQDFLSHYGEPNAVRKVAIPNNAQVPVAPQEGAEAPNFQTQTQEPQFAEEKYYDPAVDLKRAVQTGALSYEKFLELTNKDKKGEYKPLSDSDIAELNAKGYKLQTDRGQVYQRNTSTGDIKLIEGNLKPEASPHRVGDIRNDKIINRVRYTEEYQGPEKGWVTIGKSAEDKPEKTSTLSNDAIDIGAYTYKLTGKMPPIGRGKEDYDAMLQRFAMISNGAYSNPMAEKAARDVISGKQDVAVSQKALQMFATGKQGDSTRFINVGINHMETLDKAIDALGNYDIKMANRFVNPFSVELGKDPVTNFNAIKGIVADEITKAILGSAGALADRVEIKQQLSDASSLEQLKGALGKYKELFAGQLNGLKLQYESSTGRSDFDKKIGEDAKKLLLTLNPPNSSTSNVGAPIGATKVVGGVTYVKDANGWKPR